MLALDTSVLVRYLAQDDVKQSAAATHLIEQRRIWASSSATPVTAEIPHNITPPMQLPAFPRYPAPLRAGSRIAVTAPSSGVLPPLHPRLDLNLAHLRAQGFIVEEGECLRDEHLSASASADARATELMHFLLRDDIDAIFPPWGGELAIELLDRLDWPALQHVRPKWLIGYSDTSTLMLALTLRLGWASAHGPCLMDLAPGQEDSLTRGALAVLSTPGSGRVTQRQSDRWQSKWTDFAVVPDTTYSLTEITQWRCLNRSTGSVVQFSGRLIGGCIDSLMHVAGSDFGNVPQFVQRCGAEGAILYLENAKCHRPSWCVRCTACGGQAGSTAWRAC